MRQWHTRYVDLAVYKTCKRRYNILVVSESECMKHFIDLTEKERQDFANQLEVDLIEFFKQAREKYKLCDTCLHNAVAMMCENYVEDQEGMPSESKH